MIELILFFVFCAVIYWFATSVLSGIAQDWRPALLKRGTVVMIESDLRTDYPYPVAGRPDQVYRLNDGLHVPVEHKNRNHFKTYETDIAQLSLQAWLLRHNGMPTASHGYLAIKNRKTGKCRAIPVALMDDEYCSNLVERYLDVIERRVLPEKNFGQKCKSCGHRMIC